ncbi:MAG TPA: zf-HC2 domain-containing protein [Bacteroidota bacterium]|nr:zf-HC2 domain-containing protein [Bacteroidota bacterium]
MNCREFSHRITPAVDGRLTGKDQAQFREHAQLCSSCRHDFEAEQSLAALIRARLRPARVPESVLASILDGTLHSDISRAQGRSFIDFLRRPRTVPVAAFVFSFALIVYLFSRHAAQESSVEAAGFLSGSDIVHQSAANYEAVLRGEIVPQILSDRAENVRTYFNGKTEFPVFIPSMRECTLVGGIVNDYHGMRLAHVLYRHGRQMIYLYEACRESVMKGDTLHLSRAAKSDLERTGWHCCTAPDGAAVVLWVRGRTLCAAVAPMNSDHLMAHLAEADVPGAW